MRQDHSGDAIEIQVGGVGVAEREQPLRGALEVALPFGETPVLHFPLAEADRRTSSKRGSVKWCTRLELTSLRWI